MATDSVLTLWKAEGKEGEVARRDPSAASPGKVQLCGRGLTQPEAVAQHRGAEYSPHCPLLLSPPLHGLERVKGPRYVFHAHHVLWGEPILWGDAASVWGRTLWQEVRRGVEGQRPRPHLI